MLDLRLLRGEQVGAFVVRTKQGTGFVITQAVPPPKEITHHLVTIKEGDWFIDNVPVGQFRSVDGLVDVLMQDTLGVLHCPLIDVFSGGGGQSYADQYGGGAPTYDSAGTNSAANAGKNPRVDGFAPNPGRWMQTPTIRWAPSRCG